MSRKSVYKLPVVENFFVLESKYEEPDAEEKAKKKEEEIENITKESYQKGWNEALEKNREDVKFISQSMNKVIEDLKQQRDDFWSKCENGIIKLTFAIAKKAVYEDISQSNSRIIERVVSAAIDRVKEKNILRVYVNPDDAERLKAMEISGPSNAGETYEIVNDEKISRGGCKVITDCGGVDAMVETRWNEIILEFGEHSIETEGME
ncbi:MAG: FliH/SctL family protein [Candidatus Scalindua sp.]|nr:FliH/SctL family protein [Candidatus Scalindua sp.]